LCAFWQHFYVFTFDGQRSASLVNTSECGGCMPPSSQAEWRPMSCGRRSCPKCQNHEASQWIDRQQAKLLPASYFLTTLTFLWFYGRPLSPLVWANTLRSP